MNGESIEHIVRGIQRCRRCGRSSTRSHAVPGEGKVNPPLLLIGEAPGKNEDQSGRPFTGRAGRYLNRMLRQYDLHREDLYITSILKCWHPGNVKLSQIESCLEWTVRQVKAVNPGWILVMGRNAERGLFGNVTQRRLPVICHWRGKPCVITCHPAAAMRFPRQDDIFQKGLRLVSGKLALPKVAENHYG